MVTISIKISPDEEMMVPFNSSGCDSSITFRGSSLGPIGWIGYRGGGGAAGGGVAAIAGVGGARSSPFVAGRVFCCQIHITFNGRLDRR